MKDLIEKIKTVKDPTELIEVLTKKEIASLAKELYDIEISDKKNKDEMLKIMSEKHTELMIKGLPGLDKGLDSPATMEPTGEKTGVIALANFQSKGKTYKKDQECLGLSKDQIKTLKEKGMVK